MGKKIEQVEPLYHKLSDVMNAKEIIKKNGVVNVKFKKEDGIIIPHYAHDGDVGMDVTATDIEYMADIDAYVYHTGLKCETEKNVGCFLMPRSSNRKTDAYLTNSIGLVDTFTYRGEICFTFKNRTDLDELALSSALLKYDELAPWKKPFTSLRDIWREEVEVFKKNALLYAPYKVGERIGQMVFFRHPTVIIEEVDELSDTERGEGGHGSTGN